MSSVLANDENQGFSPGPEPGCDLFAVEQPTGRPSILRQSQFENIANKTVPKGVKVCFQTPRRDPVSKKILSPVKKMSVLEDCTRALESLKLMMNPQVILSEPQVPEEPSTVEPAEPTLSARGSYSFDFDNLDSVNPFNTGGSKLQNSPSLNRKSESPKAPNSTEVAGLQAQLKRDEVKRQSLEKNLEQKVREVEELTKLCDELIAKFQK
uniref:Transforming acidic coiled-coil-containing protein C-terminal domain-containing protein n=1 Tax=Denticeps clupeoides TaxID=299321 RepID=A0AAY4A7J0_9TELE